MLDFECGLIVLGMGGGKTVAGLTAMLDLMADGDLDYAIVLAPARVVNRWTEEPERWKHLLGFGVAALKGTPAKRRAMLEKEDGARVFVCSIENTVWLMDTLDELRWPFHRTMLVIDEISKFKDPASKRRKKLLQRAPEFDSRWGLTGTPRPNGYEDLFVPIKIISGDPNVWGVRDFEPWQDMYFYKTDYQGYNHEVQPHAVDILDKVCRRYMFHIDAGDLGLPDLLTGDDFIEWVAPTAEQKADYDEMYEELLLEVGEGDDEQIVEAMSQAVASGKLAQITQGFLYQDGETVYRYPRNPKIERLREMLDEMQGDNVAICYHYKEEIEALRGLLGDDVPNLGSGVSDTQAQKIIDDWNEGKVPFLLMHPASVGHGIELQFGGHQLIWYHPTWSVELYEQTVKRFHRPGQTEMVRNWRIMMKGTLDEIKDARVEGKQKASEAFTRMLGGTRK